MSALAVLHTKIYSIVFFLLLFSYPNVFGQTVRDQDWPSMQLLLTSATDIMKATFGLTDSVEYIKQNHLNSPAFEVGYVMFTLFEKYRKMVDKYNSSVTLNRVHFTVELLMYLEEIEVHHWEVEHLANMLHEIERKYAVTGGLHTKYREMSSNERNAIIAKEKEGHRGAMLSSTRRYKIKKKVLDRLTPTTTERRLSPFPHEYAAQGIGQLKSILNGSIYNDLSWPVKVLLIKDRLNEKKIARTGTEATISADAETTMEDVTSTTAASSIDPYPRRRMPAIEALVAERRQEPVKDPNEDDNSMRLKLFRLMYETIRDSDLKCKRAELIRANYEKSSTFEVGYLMGDVMDKYNIMSDISMTLNRLFHEWKPIEHINAYEQISNQAIEINHLIEMMKGISKKKDTDTDTAPKKDKL